jgi:uncharacterized protein
MSILILISSFPIFNIHTDSDGTGWFPKKSKQLINRNQFLKDFGSDELMMLYLTFPDTTSFDFRIEKLQQIGDSITANLYGFETVFSKYNVTKIGEVMGDKYAHRMEQAYFASKDTFGEMLFLKVRFQKDIITARPLLMDSLDKVLKSILPKNVKIDLSGQSVVFNEINRLSTTDSAKLFGVCFLLITLLLIWQLKRFNYLVLCIGLVLLALVPSLALFGWLDIPFNMITMTVPLLFVINFSSFAVHIITKQSSDIERYIHKKIPPILTSALATIIGFGSLTTSNIKLISQFGELTSLGIIIGLFTLLLIGVPLVVRMVSVNELITNDSLLNRFLESYYQKITRTISFIALFIIAIIIAAGIWVFPKINTDTNMINFMKSKNPVRITIEYIEKHFGAANVIDFMITKKNNQQIDNDDIRKIAEVSNQLSTLPFVKNVIGYDIWKPLVNRMSATEPVLSKQLSRGFLSEDKCRSRLTVNIPSGSVKEMEKMLNEIQQHMNLMLINTTLEITPVGFLPLYVEQMDTIVDGMLYGLGIAVLLILIVMIALVRDIKLGLITILITIFPLCGLALVMKLMNIPFDVGTSIISSVAIGMIADDALHIIWNYKRRLKKKLSEDDSLNMLFANSARKIIYPCTITSIMFSIGFAVLVFSNMIIIVNFGLLSAATIILAWISDFLIFPALLRIFYKKETQINKG